MEIIVKEVASKKDLRTFIHLPAKIHKNHTNWVPPIYLDDWAFFTPAKNKSFQKCETILALAYRGEKAVGRIMGIISDEYNQKHGEKDARFVFIETWDDSETYHALIEFVAAWGKKFGMEKLVGPLGFTDKDPQGFMIEGFGEPTVIATNCNFPYMINLAENEGFVKKVDLVVYQIKIPEKTPPVYEKIIERFNQQQPDLKVLEFTSRKAVKPLIRPVLKLVNETFNNIYGFWPFTPEEMDDFANRYLFLIDPRYIKVIMNENKQVVAFIIGMSDLSKGIQKAKGYLLPFGFFHLLRAGKRSPQLNLMLGAIHPVYQGKGLDVVMGIKMFDSARATGKTTIDSHLELEYNYKVRAEMERVGGKVYKRFRIFEKEI